MGQVQQDGPPWAHVAIHRQRRNSRPACGNRAVPRTPTTHFPEHPAFMISRALSVTGVAAMVAGQHRNLQPSPAYQRVGWLMCDGVPNRFLTIAGNPASTHSEATGRLHLVGVARDDAVRLVLGEQLCEGTRRRNAAPRGQFRPGVRRVHDRRRHGRVAGRRPPRCVALPSQARRQYRRDPYDAAPPVAGHVRVPVDPRTTSRVGITIGAVRSAHDPTPHQVVTSVRPASFDIARTVVNDGWQKSAPKISS